MRPVRVGIIGIQGKYGQWLRQFFEIMQGNGLVSEVDGSDRGTSQTNIDIALWADVVVVAVPPRDVVDVVKEIAPHLLPRQLIMDITSIKADPVAAMLESSAEVVGLHPMCAPPRTFSWRGQTVAICRARLDAWTSWVYAVLSLSGARLKSCTPEAHDRHMAIVQGLVHATELMMASVIREHGIDAAESLTFTSPVYRIALSLMGRILSQNPELYADIQMLNPLVADVLRSAADTMHHLANIVGEQNHDAFISEFLQNRAHMGDSVLQDSFDLFELISQLLNDHAGADQITLEVEQDKPGILRDIAAIFAEEEINLVSWHSFRVGTCVRFRIGCDRAPESAEMQHALMRIARDGLARAI